MMYHIFHILKFPVGLRRPLATRRVLDLARGLEFETIGINDIRVKTLLRYFYLLMMVNYLNISLGA